LGTYTYIFIQKSQWYFGHKCGPSLNLQNVTLCFEMRIQTFCGSEAV